jgi:hypothetical protein
MESSARGECSGKMLALGTGRSRIGKERTEFRIGEKNRRIREQEDELV